MDCLLDGEGTIKYVFPRGPQGSLHITNGTNMSGLLAIEYGFHVTVMVAGAILVYFFLNALRGREGPSQ